jgi:hypothetical protein
LQVVARRSVVAAEEKGRSERATGAVKKIEGIMARNKVEVNVEECLHASRGMPGSRGSSVALVVSGLAWSERAHAVSIGPKTNYPSVSAGRAL